MFYGTDFTDLVMTSNGAISTDTADTGGDLSNDCPLPAVPSTDGGARMYPEHDDLVSDNGLFEYFPDCPRASGWGGQEGCYVFHWDETIHFGGSTAFDIEAILYDTSFGIVFQWDDRNPESGSGGVSKRVSIPWPGHKRIGLQ